MNSMQEKFQISPPQNKNEADYSGTWADFESVRTSKGAFGADAATSIEYNGKAEIDDGKVPHTLRLSYNNEMPPGYNIDVQHGHNGKWTALNLAGSTDAYNDTTAPGALMNGFSRHKFSPTDDLYTDEHRDDFYDSVRGEDGEGFAERANYLDRL